MISNEDIARQWGLSFDDVEFINIGQRQCGLVWQHSLSDFNVQASSYQIGQTFQKTRALILMNSSIASF